MARDSDGEVYPVWFGTNRKPNAAATGFTGQRHDRVTRGRVDVLVPEAHRFGETGSSFWQKLRRWDLRDDTLRVQRVEQRERDAFLAEIHAAMQTVRESGESPHALVFLHGFNVTFEEAAIRAAQIGVDLKVPGATAFFSWPSRGTVRAYPADEASIEASERAITDFLVDFTSNCQAEKVHLIAHSMGNRGLLRALQRIAASAQTRGQVKFGQVFLAAPDVDHDLFLRPRPALPGARRADDAVRLGRRPAGASLGQTARRPASRLLHALHGGARHRHRRRPRLRPGPAGPLVLRPGRSPVARHLRPDPPRPAARPAAASDPRCARQHAILEAAKVTSVTSRLQCAALATSAARLVRVQDWRSDDFSERKPTTQIDIKFRTFVFVLLIAATSSQMCRADERMNVLFLWVDDGNTWLLSEPNRYSGKVVAPAIQKLANEGLLFTQAYGASPK